jgi:hypothetical protein
MPRPPAAAPSIKRLNVNLDAQLHSAFKAAAATQNTDMGKVLADFIEQYVRQHLPSALPSKKRR